MITKKPENKDNYKNPIILTIAARDAWKLVLQSLKPNSKILLPSYIGVTDREGSGIFDPVMETGLSYDFYNLNNDLSISYDELEQCIHNTECDLILLVHYFGFKIQNIKAIVALCKKHNLIVVEDCAHLFNYSLLDCSDVGTFGDFAFYSLHKFFPIPKGGLLVQNNFNATVLDVSKLKNTYSFELSTYNIQAIAKKRIENFILLDKLISNVPGITPLKKISKGDIPHNYPILIENGLREKLYFWLMERNVPLIALYYRLIDPLLREGFNEMEFLSNNILNLPVHQDINEGNLYFMTNLIEEGLIELNK